MTRFRTSGSNWEGRGWYLAPGLTVLAHQVEALYPEPQPGDGTVASQNHDASSPNSDHRPRPFDAQSGAIVRALDAGETSESETQDLVDAIVESRDDRIAYIIYEGRSIWSFTHNGYDPWVWQPYTGANPHAGHFHLSTIRSSTADNDIRPWRINMADHAHEPMPNELPRDWADGTWEQWVKRSNTDPGTRTHTFYREDLSWVYARVILPMERQIDTLQRKVELLEAGGGGSGVSEQRVRELINSSHKTV